MEELKEREAVIDVDKQSPTEAKALMQKYAVAADVAYNVLAVGVEDAEKTLQEYLPTHKIDKDLSTDNYAVLYGEKGDEIDDVIVSFRGTAGPVDVYHWGELAKTDPSKDEGIYGCGYFCESDKIMAQVKDKYKGKKITTTGHSLGGATGYYAGKKANVNSYIFNSAPTAFGISENLINTPENVSTHYYVPGDIVGGAKATKQMFINNGDRLVEVPDNHPFFQTALMRGVEAAVVGGASIIAPEAMTALAAADLAKTIITRPGEAPGKAVMTALAYKVGAGGMALFKLFGDDLHGLHNFLPTEEFDKDVIYQNDMAYKYIKSHHNHIKHTTRISTRADLTSFGESIGEPIYTNREFFIKKVCKDPRDPRCQLDNPK